MSDQAHKIGSHEDLAFMVTEIEDGPCEIRVSRGRMEVWKALFWPRASQKKLAEEKKILRSAIVQLKQMVQASYDSAITPDAKAVLLDAINSTLAKVPSDRQ